METCAKCGKKGTHNEFAVPNGEYLLNAWLCLRCHDKYFIYLRRFNKSFIQPERSKREDFVRVNCVMDADSSYPNDERLYQGCGALNIVETQ